MANMSVAEINTAAIYSTPNQGALDINVVAANLLATAVAKIGTKVGGASKDFIKKFQADNNRAFAKYLRDSSDRYGKIKTVLYKDAPKPLYDFFECNDLQFSGQLVDAHDIDNVLDISHHLIIEGAGGIGKSTILKHFFLNILTKNGLIPVFVEMKDINSSDCSLYELMQKALSRFGFKLDETYFKYAMETGCFLFLFDGFDEISNEKYNSVLNEMLLISDQYAENHFIVSSRPNDDFLKFERYSRIIVMPFTKEQSASLVGKLDYDADVKARFITKLEKDLYETHTSFASNPLLLNIMLLTFESYAEIPDKLHIFYNNAFETMYFKHDATKSGYKREMYTELSFDDFKKVFSLFCFKTYIKQMYTFSYSEIISLLSGGGYKDYNFKAEDYLNDLINSICMICSEGLEYQFTHRSFQEYFAALYIDNLPDDGQVKACRHLIDTAGSNRSGDQLLNMLNDMSPDRFEKNVLIPILKEFDKSAAACESRYDCYLDQLLTTASFHPTDDAETRFELVRRAFDDTRFDNIIDFLFLFAGNVLGIGGNYNLNDRILDVLLIDAHERELSPELMIDDLELDYESLRGNKKLYELFKLTWIGRRIVFLSELLPELERKEKNRVNELEALLGI